MSEKLIADLPEKLRVRSGAKIDLAVLDSSRRLGITDESHANQLLPAILEQISALQEQLWAAQSASLLVVLQGTDTSGKDGVIRNVVGALHPAGVKVASFKAPVGQELAHDYLWRIHQSTPARGEIVVFNRSHYESLLIERVRKFAPKKRWIERFEHINSFEKQLSDEGTVVIKFMLHISKAEQAARLQARLDDPTKLWKFNPGDLEDRKLWRQYQAAYSDVANKTTTKWAPWFVVPSDNKWVRDVAVAATLLKTLERMNPQYPPAAFDVSAIEIR